MPDAERALANVRHDMRTLLNAVLGYSELWLEDASTNATEALTAIRDEGQRLLKRVNELLDADRLHDAAYRAGLGVRLRAEMSAPVEDLAARTGALRNACGAGPEDLVADLRRIEAASAKLLAMLAGVESAAGEETSAPAVPHAAAQVAQPGGSRVLVVDDNEVNRDLLARRLIRDGHTVALAENGAQALARLESEPYDLVLLDIMMPEVDGYAALQRIRADARWPDLPVIMISSVDEMDSVVRCIEMGAEDYLPKPFNPVLLRARVNACLEKKRLREERTARQKAEQERMRWELEMAARVQQRLLPERAPEIAGLELAGDCVAARGVGGDYYDFLRLDAGHLGLVIADVAGKGMPAALVMAALEASLRSQAGQCVDSVSGLAESLNVQMHAWTDASQFVTLFYGCLDLGRRQLRYVNAGHTLPLLVRADQVISLPPVGGPVLGILPNVHYREGSVDVESGDLLVAFTDGVTEAFNLREEEFGDERLAAALLRSRELPASAICGAVIAAVREWCAGAPQSDDITLLAAKVL